MADVPHRRVLAERAFRDQLPTLLTTHPGQWAGFYGSELMDIAVTKPEVYRHCRERGLPTSEILVRCVEPLTQEVVFGVD